MDHVLSGRLAPLRSLWKADDKSADSHSYLMTPIDSNQHPINRDHRLAVQIRQVTVGVHHHLLVVHPLPTFYSVYGVQEDHPAKQAVLPPRTLPQLPPNRKPDRVSLKEYMILLHFLRLVLVDKKNQKRFSIHPLLIHPLELPRIDPARRRRRHRHRCRSQRPLRRDYLLLSRMIIGRDIDRGKGSRVDKEMRILSMVFVPPEDGEN